MTARALSRIDSEAIFNDTVWTAALAELGPVSMAAELRTLVASIGAQEQARIIGLAQLRDNELIDDDEYDDVKAEFNTWRKAATHVRNKARERLNQIKPDAQAIIEAHQVDRRALVVLAKRIWLWQQGQEHRLDTALDFEVSDGVGRRTLRELVDEIAERGEVFP